MSIKDKKLKYLECNLGDLHEGETLNLICTDASCKEGCGLICSVCRIQKHAKHQVIPLKMFLSEIQSKLNQNFTVATKVDEMLDKLDNIQGQLIYCLKESVEQMALKIKQLEEQLINSYKKVKDRILSQSFMSENMPTVIASIINGEHQNVNNLKEECKKLVVSIKVSQQNKIDLDFKPEKALESFKITEAEFSSSMKKFTQLFSDATKPIEKILERAGSNIVETSLQTLDFKFSSTLKSEFVKIEGNAKIATQTTSSSSNLDKRIALVEQALDTSQKTQWAFKIKALNNWVGLGIGLKKILQSKAYKFESSTMGHGCYIISNNGYSWSHSRKEDNQQQKAFQFLLNDIIICELDPIAKTLTFIKSKDDTKFVLSIEIPENDTLHPQVNLHNLNESIEIVSNEELEKILSQKKLQF